MRQTTDPYHLTNANLSVHSDCKQWDSHNFKFVKYINNIFFFFFFFKLIQNASLSGKSKARQSQPIARHYGKDWQISKNIWESLPTFEWFITLLYTLSYVAYSSCQSSAACVTCSHLLFPYLVCFLSLLCVIISSFLSSCVCLIFYDYPVYL